MTPTLLIPQAGHIRHPRPGMPWVYIGRNMPRLGLKDAGWGNPYRKGRNSEDPVLDYDYYLDGRPDLLARLPELVGKDLLCWCRGPGEENDGSGRQFPWVCHGDPLIRRVRLWAREHPAEAAQIRAALAGAVA